MSAGVISRRLQQGIFEALATSNRTAGSGAGAGIVFPVLGYAAAGNQGAYSTVNSSTWADITNTTFTIPVSRTVPIEYRFYVAAHLSAAGSLGYVRGDIVSYDVTAALEFGTTGTTNGTLWYMALASGKGPLQPGTYTVKLQAATDNNTFSITIDQFFHQVIQLG